MGKEAREVGSCRSAKEAPVRIEDFILRVVGSQ